MENEIQEQQTKDSMGKGIKIFAMVIMAIGLIISTFAFLASLVVAISILISSIILGVMVLGLGEIIVILEDIRDSLKKDEDIKHER